MSTFGLLVPCISSLVGPGFALPPYPPPSVVELVTDVIDEDTIDVFLQTIPEGLAGELSEGRGRLVPYLLGGGLLCPGCRQKGGL